MKDKRGNGMKRSGKRRREQASRFLLEIELIRLREEPIGQKRMRTKENKMCDMDVWLNFKRSRPR